MAAQRQSELVTYRDELWKKLADHVWPLTRGLMHDFWDPEITRKFLVQRPGEPSDAYQNRCKLAVLNNYFKPAVRSYAALLSEYTLEDHPESLEKFLSDVDLQGNDLRVFLANVDSEALAMGAVLVVVDYSKPLERPYLIYARIDDICGVKVICEDGRHYLERMSIRYEVEVEAEGKLKSEVRYLHYQHRPARVSILREKEKGGDLETLEAEKPIKPASGRPFVEIPVIWYSFSPGVPGKPCSPPFYSLARLNLLHFNKDSEINTAETICNTPTVVRQHPGPKPEKTDPIYLGSNYGIEIPAGGSISFLETGMPGLSLTHSRQVERQEQMTRLGQEFLSGGGAARTATEAILDAQQSKQELRNMAARKESLVEEIFKLWQYFADPRYTYPDPAGRLNIAENILTPDPGVQDVAAIEGLFASGIITRPTALAMLARMGWIEPDELESEQKAQKRMDAERAAMLEAELQKTEEQN